jgi:hypothetical protein
MSGRRYGHISISEEHLAQTHQELMNRIDDPTKTIAVRVEIDAPLETVWGVAAESVSRFFSHHPNYAGFTYINLLGSDEGGRYVIHRASNSGVIDRTGEILVQLPLSQLTVSDIDIADPSVSGFFQALYTIRVEPHPENAEMTVAFLSYTMLGIAPSWALGSLVYQAHSIRHALERPRLKQ